MIKKFFISLILFLLIIQSAVVDTSFAITAEERLEEVEKQLIAVANQIKQYEGEKTDLEKAILANDAAIKKVNDELAVVQKEFPEIKPVDAERAYRLAYEKYSDNRDKGFASMREEYKKGSAGQLKGKDAITKKSKPGGNETTHPARGKLVGEDDAPRISAAIGNLDIEDSDPYMLIARGLQKSVSGEVLSQRERKALKPYVKLFTKLLTTPQFRSNMIAMNKILKGKDGSK